MPHVYCGAESLNMTAQQRSTLHAAIRAIGRQSDPQPALVNHWRIRTDGLAVIYEAQFADAEITARAFAGYVAGVFGVDPALVTDTTGSSQFGPIVTLRYSGSDRLRAVMFGGAAPTWAESRAACAAYLAASAAAWGDA